MTQTEGPRPDDGGLGELISALIAVRDEPDHIKAAKRLAELAHVAPASIARAKVGRWDQARADGVSKAELARRLGIAESGLHTAYAKYGPVTPS